MRKRKYLCGVVEKWNPHAHIRQDLFGIIDVICCKPGEKTIGLQVTSYKEIKSHIDKALSKERIENLKIWLAAGNRFVIHGWKTIKAEGKLNTYELHEREIVGK